MRRLEIDYWVKGVLSATSTFLLCALVVSGCVGTMTPKKQLTMMYGTYNSQYTQYMVATGYTMNEAGQWEKKTSPVLTDDQKKILRKKKEILTQMYPLVKVYDSMVVGTIPYSSATEQELMNLVDQLAALGGV